MASIHKTADDVHDAGVMDKRTMREFDDLCLTPAPPLKPSAVYAKGLSPTQMRKKRR
jgi:putative transcriptional regulator